MPAKSQAQRGYLAANFGPAWMKQHHFDNPGKLPQYSRKKMQTGGLIPPVGNTPPHPGWTRMGTQIGFAPGQRDPNTYGPWGPPRAGSNPPLQAMPPGFMQGSGGPQRIPGGPVSSLPAMSPMNPGQGRGGNFDPAADVGGYWGNPFRGLGGPGQPGIPMDVPYPNEPAPLPLPPNQPPGYGQPPTPLPYGAFQSHDINPNLLAGQNLKQGQMNYWNRYGQLPPGLGGKPLPYGVGVGSDPVQGPGYRPAPTGTGPFTGIQPGGPRLGSNFMPRGFPAPAQRKPPMPIQGPL